jgi:hypothetical protein
MDIHAALSKDTRVIHVPKARRHLKPGTLKRYILHRNGNLDTRIESGMKGVRDHCHYLVLVVNSCVGSLNVRLGLGQLRLECP